MKREAKQEIRRVLMGRTLIAEDGRLVAMEKGRLRMPMGVRDGAVSACLLGVCRKARRLRMSCSEKEARRLAFEVMKDIGRGLYLPEQPEAVACLMRNVLTRPAVLIFDCPEGTPVLTAWTGRSLLAWLSLRRSLNAFIRKMPKQFTVSQEAAPEDIIEKKEKKRKKAKRRGKEREAFASDPAAEASDRQGGNEQ